MIPEDRDTIHDLKKQLARGLTLYILMDLSLHSVDESFLNRFKTTNPE